MQQRERSRVPRMKRPLYVLAFAVGVLGGEAPTGYVGRDEAFAVSHVADHGETPEGWQLPLRHCHGDCDTDADCDHHFFCFQRSADETVPGCPVMDGHAPKTGFDYCVKRNDHPNVPKLEDQTIASQTTHAPLNNFFAAKIADADWNPCTHLKCVVENHECTHGTHENYLKPDLHKAPEYHGTHKLYPGAGKVYAKACAPTRSLRVYHHTQEQNGFAHHCATTATNECFCRCAQKDPSQKWESLGDEASGLYAPTTATCPSEATLATGQRCTSRQINGTPNNPLLATTDWSVCKAECERLGSGCVEFGQGVCRCFDRKVFQPPHLEPATGPQYTGIKSGVCADTVQHPDRYKALEYYGKAAALGNKRAEARIASIHKQLPLFGHFTKKEQAACQDIDSNSVEADPGVALTARCQCLPGFWKVNAGHIFMTKCAPCPTNSHATTSSVGTNTCTCDAGRKLTAQDTDLLCELPDHPSDEVGKYEMSLDARQDGDNSEISVALDEQPGMQELVRGGN